MMDYYVKSTFYWNFHYHSVYKLRPPLVVLKQEGHQLKTPLLNGYKLNQRLIDKHFACILFIEKQNIKPRRNLSLQLHFYIA